ncbi:MAG: 50S ribosomal protein L1 [Spirochaetaceae bacterium]|jgi:large subunit ribosomal protein L1|nr:50S ribosomal protein L1 [Spirochaetaceae bacterium]
MARNGKRYRAALEAIDRRHTYPVEEGLKLLKGLPPAKFDETVEIAVRVTLRGNQTVRDTMVLPHSFEQEQRILVFAEGDKAREAEEAGATYVGGQELIDRIKDGWLEFDVTVATPDMMRNVGRLGPILGRRGLMPNPKTRTVTQDVAGTIAELKRGRVEFRADRTGVVHLPIGRLSMDGQALAENARSVVAEVERKRPADTKGDFLRSVAVCTTMSPGVKVAV